MLNSFSNKRYKGSIKKRLISIIFIVAILTSFVGYGSFVYWYMGDQQKRSLKLANTVANILSQDLAKLILLNEVSAATDISSNLKSFPTLTTMVLYKLDKKAIFQYSKNDTTFIVEPLPAEFKKDYLITNNILKLYIDAKYQDTLLGYVELNFKIDNIWDVIRQNIKMLIFILLFMFIVSYLLSLFFAKRFTEPILKLVKFLEKIEMIESLNKKIYTKEENEYGKLYDEVNTMLERIMISQQALKIAAVSFETQSGMTITDAKHRILQVNKAFTTITGYEEVDVVGKTPIILKSGIHDRSFYDNMHQLLRKNHYWSGEITNKHKNGTIFTEYLTIQVVMDDNKEIQYYVASFTDITIQKETEKKLKQKEYMLVQQSKMAAMGEMLGNIAHQWRQPLSLISTISTGMLLNKELEMELSKEDEMKKLNKINDTSQYLSQTIDDFRNFFKSNKTKVKFNIKDSYLKTLSLINSKFKSLEIEVVENLNDIDLVSLENEFMQVMMNILNNARDILETIDTQSQKRIIFVDIYKEDNNAKISIKDNAGGVPKDIIPKIFEPYFTTKHKSQGTGIGLYMSAEMVIKHMNGELIVENETFTYEDIEYTGASFTITIPLS